MTDDYEHCSREQLIERLRAAESQARKRARGAVSAARSRTRALSARGPRDPADAVRAARAASDAKDRFLAVLSHELRTPLTSVLLAMDELAREVTSERARHLVALVARNVRLEAQLIDDLLDVTRITRGKLAVKGEPVDLREILDSTLDLCAGQIENAGQSVHTTFRAESHWVCGDSTRLHQIFWNLVRNAVQHTPSGGTIAIATENREAHLVVSVSDNGRGIPPEIAERLFEPFEQAETRPEGGGLGLGLTIARGLAEAHGGTIRVVLGSEGQGTTFEVTFPITTESERPPPPATRPPPGAGERPRILLVEDDADSAFMLAAVLERYGYQARAVCDAASALDAAKDPFDVIVSDLGLPDGTGHELLGRLRQTCAAPAIALSGHGGDEDVRRALSAGFAIHLLKPTSPADLIDAIEQVRGAPAPR